MSLNSSCLEKLCLQTYYFKYFFKYKHFCLFLLIAAIAIAIFLDTNVSPLIGLSWLNKIPFDANIP